MKFRMTELLERAIAKLKTLPASEQDAIALSLDMLKGDRFLYLLLRAIAFLISSQAIAVLLDNALNSVIPLPQPGKL